jgi:hypothetical protein
MNLTFIGIRLQVMLVKKQQNNTYCFRENKRDNIISFDCFKEKADLVKNEKNAEFSRNVCCYRINNKLREEIFDI